MNKKVLHPLFFISGGFLWATFFLLNVNKVASAICAMAGVISFAAYVRTQR